jgi:hypothetical protein
VTGIGLGLCIRPVMTGIGLGVIYQNCSDRNRARGHLGVIYQNCSDGDGDRARGHLSEPQ